MGRTLKWTALILLLALRLPSLVQPAGADQSLYAYVGLRILEGGAPYIDAWDQKPPGIHLLYAAFWWIWPDERVVNAADLFAAVGVCWLLVVLGRRLATPGTGWLAACLFALLANPSMHRLSGVYVRGQCETFIALAVTAALVLATDPRRRWPAAAAAGVLIGIAIWLKYNAVLFGFPVFLAAWIWRPADAATGGVMREWQIMTGAALLVGVAGLGWLAAHGALTDLWLATFRYNVAYSAEGFTGPTDAMRYLVTMPVRQGHRELIWFAGLVGTGLAAAFPATRRAAQLSAVWIGAAVGAIALNGRDLPQYFVQATPALAFAGAVGLLAAWKSKQIGARVVAVAVLALGLTRVGVDTPVYGLARLAGLPGLWANVTFDASYARGHVDRHTYLDRFGGQRDQDKYSALDVDTLAVHIATETGPDDTVLVFGFTPGAYVKAHRRSASRFFWSPPVILEFAADQPGYGSRGLLEDLEASRPMLVVLQKQPWDSPDSATFFLNQPALSAWLAAGYSPASEDERYAIWKRRPAR